MHWIMHPHLPYKNLLIHELPQTVLSLDIEGCERMEPADACLSYALWGQSERELKHNFGFFEPGAYSPLI